MQINLNLNVQAPGGNRFHHSAPSSSGNAFHDGWNSWSNTSGRAAAAMQLADLLLDGGRGARRPRGRRALQRLIQELTQLVGKHNDRGCRRAPVCKPSFGCQGPLPAPSQCGPAPARCEPEPQRWEPAPRQCPPEPQPRPCDCPEKTPRKQEPVAKRPAPKEPVKKEPVQKGPVQKEPVKETPQKEGKMWDVWFDHKDGQTTKRRSPLVLDLNRNGKADVTGENVLGDGKVTGPTTKFDIDPTRDSYEHKSKSRATRALKDMRKNPEEFRGNQRLDKHGNVEGELKADGLYHYGDRETREKTEWLKKGGGDGLLVWDVNSNGKIESSKELFGEFDIDGSKKFADGYDKLGHHFDKNGDGTVSGKELNGLQIWKDDNADGVTQKGELQSLAQYGITSFDVGGADKTTMESSFTYQ